MDRRSSSSPVRSPTPYYSDRSLSPESLSPVGRTLRSRSMSPTRMNSLEHENHDSASSFLNSSNSDEGNDGVDRISNLPDLVLHHILSFMDMKEVIGNTSLISRRWRNLWISLRILNFDHSMWHTSMDFYKFLGRVLLRRDNSLVKSMCISCFDKYRFDRMENVEDWMQFAARKHVEEVCIDFDYSNSNSFDEENIFPWPCSSNNIQIFKLSSRRHLLIPHSICLAPQLKSLELDLVILPEGRVTVSCSALENLTITNCDHQDVTILNITAPKLNNLVLKNDANCFGNETCKLQISTPNLRSLLLKGSLYEAYSLENLSLLVYARFETQEVIGADFLRNILRRLHNVKTLELCGAGATQTTSGRSLHRLDHGVRLSNLRCLNLVGWSGGPCIHTIHSLLMNSYSVEALVLEINQVIHARDWGELFQCIYRLKSIDIKGVKGCDNNELKFLEFILRNAVALEELTLYTVETFRHVRQREELAKYNMKIYSLPRASSNVKILAFF